MRKRERRTEIEEDLNRYERAEEPPQLPVGEIEEGEPSPGAEQPAPAPRIIPTRIPGLDNLIGGGLPNISLILVVGTIGSNYGTFIGQVLYNHLSEGGKVAYYTAETSSLDVMQEMESFGWSMREFLDGGRWLFVDILTPDLQQLAELAPEGFNLLRVTLSQSLNGLKTDLLGKIKEDRWTVLHLSHILHNYDLREVMDLLLYWRAAVRAYGGVHFAVLPSGVHPDTSVNALKNIADGIVEFQLKEGPRDYEGILFVQKLRGLRMARRIAFAVMDDGISVETAERIR